MVAAIGAVSIIVVADLLWVGSLLYVMRKRTEGRAFDPSMEPRRRSSRRARRHQVHGAR